MSKMNSFSALPTQTAAALLQMFYHLSDTSQKPRSYLSSFPPKTVISVSSIYILFCIPFFPAVHISEWSLIWAFHSSSSSIIITNICNYKPDHMGPQLIHPAKSRHRAWHSSPFTLWCRHLPLPTYTPRPSLLHLSLFLKQDVPSEASMCLHTSLQGVLP